MGLREKPFAALLLKDFGADESRKKELLLFLTLAYLLSAHIPFVFPLPSENCRMVDAQFDEVIKGLALKSKGIVYQKDLSVEQLRELRTQAALLLTDELIVADENSPPCISLQPATQGIKAQLHRLEKLTDADLKSQIVGCVRLINVLSGGVLSRGHFSLSW